MFSISTTFFTSCKFSLDAILRGSFYDFFQDFSVRCVVSNTGKTLSYSLSSWFCVLIGFCFLVLDWDFRVLWKCLTESSTCFNLFSLVTLLLLWVFLNLLNALLYSVTKLLYSHTLDFLAFFNAFLVCRLMRARTSFELFCLIFVRAWDNVRCTWRNSSCNQPTAVSSRSFISKNTSILN